MPIVGRTLAVRGELEMEPTRYRNRRMELRTTLEERELIERAAEARGLDLTSFIVPTVCAAASAILADRDLFKLDDAAMIAWEELNTRPSRSLPGLLALAERPSPFIE